MTLRPLLLPLLFLSAMFAHDLLDGLRPHPRLLLDAERAAALRLTLTEDPALAGLAQHLRREAAALLAQPVSEHRMEGRRLLVVSREVQRRCLLLGTVWRLDGDLRLRDRLLAECEAVSAFSDWNPAHFLDVAEMAAGLAIAYDWLLPELGRERLASVRTALLAKALGPGADDLAWWVRAENNWNQVCHGGLALACLALAEEVPELAHRLLERAREQQGLALVAYAPDGVYPEGPNYWGYGTGYSVLLEAALESATGTGWGLLDRPGLAPSFDQIPALLGPGGFFNFSDCSPRSGPSPWHRWAGARLGRPTLTAYADARLDEALAKGGHPDRFLPLELLWWQGRASASPGLPLAWSAGGAVELAVLRSAWDDRRGLFAALKAGQLGTHHGHLDAGGFVFDADGRRWALDLGMDREIYARTDTWGREQDSLRWTFLRCGAQGHSVPQLGGLQQRVAGRNPLLGSGEAADGRRWALADLSAAYAGAAASVRRGLALLPDRGLLLQDEFAGSDPALPLRWRWLAPGSPQVADDGRSVRLSHGGERCTLQLLAPATGRFAVVPATPDRGEEEPNPDCAFVVLDLPAPLPDPLTVAVLARPGSASATAARPALRPLAAWSTR